MSAFLILHGLEGSGPDHWQSWLARRLSEAGARVDYPPLPEPFDPAPEAWDAALERALAGEPAERVVICHSLACLLWLRAAARSREQLADRVLLVAPPWREDPAVARFTEHGAEPGDVARAARETLIVCSDADPYCPPGAVETYARPLRVPATMIPDAGHFNPESGYGPWPQVEAWAVEGAPLPGPLP